MYVPRVRAHVAVPRRVITALAAICAVLTAVLVAALFTASTGDDPNLTTVSLQQQDSPGSVVYSTTRGNEDVVVVETIHGGEKRVVARFPVSAIGLHIRGTTSPTGGHVAVLGLESGFGAEAHLTVIDVAGESRQTVDGTFDYLSRMTWRPDGTALALTRPLESEDSDAGYALLEVDVPSLELRTLQVFESALSVAPVGYGLDGRMLVVVVNQQGSSLWAYANGESAVVVKFSPGLTSDWSLSPDGSRLAFIDHLGLGNRSRAGRVLAIATGKVTDFAPRGEQLGAVWRPGSPAPDFGGPGGSVALTGGEPGSYLVPLSWTSDGRYLIATVVDPNVSGGDPIENIEIVSEFGRVRLADGEDSRFLGLVPGG